MSAQLVIPDCSGRVRGFGLTQRQRRELIRVLAQEGPGGLESWLKAEEHNDPRIREWVDLERARVEREARARRRRIEARHGEEAQEHARSWEKRMREMAAREEALKERIAFARDPIPITPADIEGSSLLRPGRVGFLRRVWVRIVELWVTLIRFLTGRREAPRPHTTIHLPEGVPLDLAGGLAPDMVVQIQRRAGATMSRRERMRRWWDRFTGRESLQQQARRAVEQELARIQQDKQTKAQDEAEAAKQALQELEKQQRHRAREHKEQDQGIQERQRREIESLSKEEEQAPYQSLRTEVLDQMQEAGLTDQEGNARDTLVLRFSQLLYDEARRTIPSTGQATPGTYVSGDGDYERGPLQSANEIGQMELVDSLLQARTRHPEERHIYDDDILVHREIRTSTTHIVLILDLSGSMEEEGRLEAAKRVALVLYQAAKDQNPDHRVDILGMHTEIEHLTLAETWKATPKGFTNHGAALREARHLLTQHGADQKLLYLITDGLPEAHTLPDGTDQADNPKVCMQYARKQAREIHKVGDLHAFIVQLENNNKLFVQATDTLAADMGARVDAVEPSALMAEVLGDFDQSGITTNDTR